MLKNKWGDFPGGAAVKESAYQCRGHGFNPWSWKIPHVAEQLSHLPQLLSLRCTACDPQLLSLRATTTEARTPRTHDPQQEKPQQ